MSGSHSTKNIDEYFTVADYAKLNLVTPETVQLWCRKGDIPAIRLTDAPQGQWRIPKTVTKRPPKVVRRLKQRRARARERDREAGIRGL